MSLLCNAFINIINTYIHEGLTAIENAFRPTFGRTPPELFDREDTLEEFEYGLRIRSGVLGLSTITAGARGVGKTVMLNGAQDLPQGQGWAAISETSTDGFLTRIAAATLGYPFLIQLIGYLLWRESEASGGTVAPESVNTAIHIALKRNIRMVVEPAIARAFARDMSYLRAMALETGPSSTAAVAKRMDASLQLATNYRARLIVAGLIESAGRGEVRFSIPGLREYLRDDAN